MLARTALVLALVQGSSAAQQTASTVCVYNAAAFVLKWRLHDVAGKAADSAETKSYPVGQVKCMSADIDGPQGGNVTVGSEVVPVIQAVWGKEITTPDTILYDPVNATQVTYVCKGTTLDFHCEQGPPPPTAANVTKAVGEFVLGFTEGIGTEIGFADCIADVNKTFHDVVAIVDFFEQGFHGKVAPAVARAFKLIGGVLQDFGNAITACVKDADDFVAKMKELSGALSGNPWDVVKVIIDDALHVWRERKEISTDCKAVTADWRAQDYKGSGDAVGDIVGIILAGL